MVEEAAAGRVLTGVVVVVAGDAVLGACPPASTRTSCAPRSFCTTLRVRGMVLAGCLCRWGGLGGCVWVWCWVRGWVEGKVGRCQRPQG